MTSYPCPACGSSATLDAPCPGCGRAPDPAAAEVIRLDGTIRELTRTAEVARLQYDTAMRQLANARAHRDALAAQVIRDLPRAPRSGPPLAAATPAEPAQPRSTRPEASTATVQTVLFALGGLLLGTAAIVFTAVAWATFGEAGRAGILATFTAVALALSVLALRRGLASTAETFASLGLLLVVLDGYAARTVNLFGVAEATDPSAYAAGVCALTVVVAAGYGKATRLFAPRLAAILAGQPVLPLLAVQADPDAGGWSLVFGAVAAVDLALLWRWSTRATPGGRLLRPLLWALHGTGLGAAALAALVAEATAHDPAEAAWAGLALIVVAAILLASAAVTGVATLRVIASAAATLAVTLAVGRLAVLASPERALALTSAIVALTALGALLVPAGWRTGAKAGAVIAVAAVGSVVAVLAASIAARTAFAVLPPWHGELNATAVLTLWGGAVPIAVTLVAAGALALVSRTAWPVPVVLGTAFVALTIPSAVRLQWWAPATVDLVVAVPLALLAVRLRAGRATVLCGPVAAVLAGHAVLAGSARPSSMAAVLWTILFTCALASALALPQRRRAIGGVPLALGIVALPFATATTVAAADGGAVLMLRLAVATIAVALAVVAAVRRLVPGYLPYAVLGTSGVAAGTGLIPPISGEPAGPYAAIGLVALAGMVLLTSTAGRPPRTAALAAAPFPAIRLLVSVAPALSAVLLLPYSWLDAIWLGAPTGVGLAPRQSPGVEWADAIALALTTLAAGIAGAAWSGRRRRGSNEPARGSDRPARDSGRGALASALLVGPTAVLLAAAAAGAPWPTIPGLALGIGLGAALVAALWRPNLLTGPAAVQAISLTGVGLAGSLPTKPGTLIALGSLLVTAVVIGRAGHALPARLTGWIAAVVAAALTAIAASLAADLPLRFASYALLAVAAITLAAGAWRAATHRLEGRALEAAAHATALLSVLIAGSPFAGPEALRQTAILFTLWGIAVGLRALWPDMSATRRRALAVAAAGSELIAWWLLLSSRRVEIVEAYTLPAAVLALGAGWLALRTRPELRSWVAYGPALAAAFLPSLASVLFVQGDPVRRLLLGTAGVAAVIAGSVRRRQAPVVAGGGVLVLLALHELVVVWDLLDRWIPLAVAGLLLVGLAMTYERRRRDMVRLRETIGRMT